MKKGTVILISIVSIGIFLSLVYYGLRHSRGKPVSIEESEKITLKVPYNDAAIDLKEGISSGIWDELAPQNINMIHQVMILPWGKSLVSPLTVKAFHNREDIYFYLSWNDETKNGTKRINKFSDACGVMFPIEKKVQPSMIMMGFMGKANIWQWKADQDDEYWNNNVPNVGSYADFHYPFEKDELFIVSKKEIESAVNDLLAVRIGTITRKNEQNVRGRGLWGNGTWQVVLKRSLNSAVSEDDVLFLPDNGIISCAFAVWNGANGDRGVKKSISNWVELEIKN